MLTIGIPRETLAGERRVAQIPETVSRLITAGAEVHVQSGAGEAAGFRDDAYAQAGAKLIPDAGALFQGSALVLKVRAPSNDETERLAQGSALVALLDLPNPQIIERLAARKITAFALEKVPRTTRAQRMDVLSSMSTVAGYKAMLLGANSLGRFFPLLMTAAGTIPPARVFVLGAGVAGLQVIATARRLGAIVEAFDVRPAVREEVESLGATFVATELTDASHVDAGGYAKALSHEEEAKERTLIAKHVANADVVVTTANIPGRRAPVLVTVDMVRAMKGGSVIVDLAAESGGNCELTRAGEEIVAHNVTILGTTNLASALPGHASQMFARNVLAFVNLFIKSGAFTPDWNDDILAATCVTRDGQILGAPPSAASPPSAGAKVPVETPAGVRP